VLGLCGQCTGAEEQLQSISSALAREMLDKAERILDSLEQSYPNCPETLLDRARSGLERKRDGLPRTLRRYQELAPGCVPRLRLPWSLFVGAKN